jgi:hypothetical protein
MEAGRLRIAAEMNRWLITKYLAYDGLESKSNKRPRCVLDTEARRSDTASGCDVHNQEITFRLVALFVPEHFSNFLY